MTITLSNTQPKIKGHTPVDPETIERRVIVQYVFPRRSPKRNVDDPNEYTVTVDEQRCTTGPCQCDDFKYYRSGIPGEQCKHQLASVQKAWALKRKKWAESVQKRRKMVDFVKEIERLISPN